MYCEIFYSQKQCKKWHYLIFFYICEEFQNARPGSAATKFFAWHWRCHLTKTYTICQMLWYFRGTNRGLYVSQHCIGNIVAATFSYCLFYSFFFRRRDFSLHLEATKQSTVWTVIDRVRVYLYFCVCASLHRNFYILNLNLSIHQNRMYI